MKTEVQTKVCQRCKLPRELTDFTKNQRWCRSCMKEYRVEYNKKNVDKRKVVERRYRVQNKEKIAARHRAYYAEHKAYYRERGQVWRTVNPERNREQNRRNQSKNRLRYRYGLSDADIQVLLAVQEGRCPGCQRSFSQTLEWQVDHDHACCLGTESCGSCVRGLLCRACNSAIGLLADSLERLERLGSYIQQGGISWQKF